MFARSKGVCRIPLKTFNSSGSNDTCIHPLKSVLRRQYSNLITSWRHLIVKKVADPRDFISWIHNFFNDLMMPLCSPVRLAYVRIEGKDTDPDPSPTPLFICHGLFGAKKNWRSIAKQLNSKTSREIVAIDARNHGNSDHHPDMNYFVQALDAKHLIQKLDYSKVIMIGHSMGGKVAMTMALSYPELVEKVIVIDSSPAPSISDEDIQRYLKTKLEMDLSKIKSKRDAEKMMMNTVPSQILRQFFLTNLVPSPEGGYRWRINLEAIENNIQDIMDFPSIFPHKKFTGKAIFIGGGRSKYIQEKDYTRIYQLFPEAEITFIPDCGHWVHAEKPKELMTIMEDFVARYP